MQLITRIFDVVNPLLLFIQQHPAPSSTQKTPSSPTLSKPNNNNIGNNYATVAVQIGHVIESLCVSVRPPILAGLKPFEELVVGVHSVAPSLPLTCAAKLYPLSVYYLCNIAFTAKIYCNYRWYSFPTAFSKYDNTGTTAHFSYSCLIILFHTAMGSQAC